MRRENVGPANASTQRLAAHGPRVPHRPRAGPGPGTPLAKFLPVFEGGFCLQKRDAAAAAGVLCLTDADSLPDPRPHGDPPFSEEAAEARRAAPRRGWRSSGPGVGAKPSAGRPARGSRCKRRAAARRSWSQGVQRLRQNATMGVACDHSVCVCVAHRSGGRRSETRVPAWSGAGPLPGRRLRAAPRGPLAGR